MILNNKRILIAGGFGFIGSNFVNHLLMHGSNPMNIGIIDNMTYAANFDNVPKFSDLGITHIDMSIANRSWIVSRLNLFKPNIIVNFAAESHVDKSLDNAQVFYNTNILGVDVLARWCSDNKIGLVQISTDEVYGDVEIPKSKELIKEFTEESPLKPNNPYAVSKASGDMLIQSISRSFGLDYLIIRMSNNFGENQFYEKLTPKIIFKAMYGQHIPLYAGGHQIREWIYVQQAVTRITNLINKWFFEKEIFTTLPINNEIPIFNIGSGIRITNKNYVNFIIIEMTKKGIYNKKCKIINVKDRPGHDQAYALNCRKYDRFMQVYDNLDLIFYNFEKYMSQTIDYYNKKYLEEGLML